MNEEEWRPVVGYEGLYEVAKSGAVRNVQTGKVLAARNTHHGYKSVSLQTTGVGGKNHLVHRLVLAAWVGPAPSPQHQAAHLNGERTDNRLENLIWATARENNDHKKRHGTHRCGDAIANAKLNAKTVEEIRRMRAGGAQLREIAKAFGISRVTAGAVAGSRRWKHVAHCSMCIALIRERDAAIARAEAAEAKLADADTGEGWIACSERMPERLTPVLVAEAMNDGAGPIVRAAFWNGDAWRDQSATAITASDMDPTDVYAWRPLPAPPRTDDEKEGR